MAETNPTVALRHPGLDRTTSQPLSAARHLLGSGWQPADQNSADHLGVEYQGDDQASEPSPAGKTAKEMNEASSKSTTNKGKGTSTTKSDDK